MWPKYEINIGISHVTLTHTCGDFDAKLKKKEETDVQKLDWDLHYFSLLEITRVTIISSIFIEIHLSGGQLIASYLYIMLIVSCQQGNSDIARREYKRPFAVMMAVDRYIAVPVVQLLTILQCHARLAFVRSHHGIVTPLARRSSLK